MSSSTRTASAPLAALFAVLAALALVGLARGWGGAAPPPAPVPIAVDAGVAPDAGPSPEQVLRLLAERPMDLNAASARDLELLPGIGPTLAARIVEERDHAEFDAVAELTRVRGIGPRTLERLAPLLTVSPADPEPSVP